MAQLTNPTYRDWISQVLHKLEDVQIQLEIHKIELMSKYKYKHLIKEAVYSNAFWDLIKRKEGRSSDNSKGKQIKHQELKLSEYLGPDNENLTVEEKKWMF